MNKNVTQFTLVRVGTVLNKIVSPVVSAGAANSGNAVSFGQMLNGLARGFQKALKQYWFYQIIHRIPLVTLHGIVGHKPL